MRLLPKGWIERILLVLVGIIVASALAEWAVRALDVRPPTQVVRGNGLRLAGDVAVWTVTRDREHTECVEHHPERTRILFVGSSITYGVGLDAADVFTAKLEERLNALRPSPGFCVLNFAQAAFGWEQKWAVLREEVPRVKPALTFVEHWDAQWYHYAVRGDMAYSTRGVRLRSDGVPGFPGIPGVLNDALFAHSRVYEYLALVPWESDAPDDTPTRFAAVTLAPVPGALRAMGTRPVFVLATTLDRPLAEPRPVQRGWQDPIRALALQQGVPVYSLTEELASEDYLAIRLDPCCHFNAAGHRSLERALERIVLRELDRP
jgi:hypothetical protein